MGRINRFRQWFGNIEEDWERNLVASCSNADDDCLASSDEDGNSQDDASAPTISSRIAVNYLQELKEFALFHKNQELLDYFTQSQLIVEQTFSQNNTTQTKLPDIAPVTNESSYISLVQYCMYVSMYVLFKLIQTVF